MIIICKSGAQSLSKSKKFSEWSLLAEYELLERFLPHLSNEDIVAPFLPCHLAYGILLQ
jgi:hypothetical protein